MITLMRRYRKSLQVGLLIVILAFVASLFIFGSQSFDGGLAGDAVATVNGEPVSYDRFQRRYQEVLNAYRQLLQERFSPALVAELGLARQVVEDLVLESLVVQRAQREGLGVSNEELNVAVHGIAAFQEAGRFTAQRYEEVLRRLGYTPAAFEGEMRRRLTRSKVESLVRAGVRVSDAEVEQAWAERNEQVRAAWALVEIGPIIASLTPTDEELAAYLKEHPDEFREPERRRVQYVAFDRKDFIRPVPEAEVEKYYREHGQEFEVPRQARVSHILARIPEVGGSAAEDRARAKVAEAIRRAKAGEDFARLARELSEDPATARQGGEVGFIRPGETVPAFEEAVFALGPGQVSPEPVRTPLGFHAIKVHAVRAGGRTPLKEVADEIRQRLQRESADGAARARAEEIRAKLLGAADFMGEARKLGLSPVETVMARRPPTPGLPPDTMEETAFELAVGGVSLPVGTPAGWAVMKSAAALPAAVPPLAEIKDKVAAAVKRQRAETIALERARRIAAEATGSDFGAAARQAGATYGETGLFSRAKPAERLPGDAMLAALSTPAGSLTEPVKTSQGYYVLKPLERVPPDRSGLEAERDRIRGELLARKQGQAWESWLRAARAGAKVEVSSRLPTPRG